MNKSLHFLAAVFLGISLTSCTDNNENDLKIGIDLPLSGNLASYGKLTLDGVKMKVDEINNAGGIDGKKIRLVIEDNKGDTAEARNVFRKLTSSYKVPVVLGPITSSCSLAMKRDAEVTKIPFVTPTATNDKVTAANPYVFRACFNDSFQGKILANYAAKSKMVKTAAIMIDSNSDYSKGLAQTFKDTFIAAGGAIVAEETYRQKDIEFGIQLKKIKDSNAEIIFIPGLQPEVPLIIKQAKALDLKSSFCGADGWDNDIVINGSGDNIEGSFIVAAFSLEDKRPAVQKFLADYEKLHPGKKPGTFTALGYDAATMIIDAFKHGSKAEEIKTALSSIRNLELVTGKATVTQEGDLEKNAVILEIKKGSDGKYASRYKAYVSP